MDVQLTKDQQAFAQQAIESGRLRGEEEVFEQALALWEGRERVRAQVLSAVSSAEASLEAGQGRIITPESMQDLANEVKLRGRARLAADPTARG